MKPYGLGRKQVLIVGEAPGETEDEEGRPFIGKAGQRLRETLSSIGILMDKDCVTTNALICRPPHNATPDEKRIDWCRPNLSNAIKETEPRVIITLGRAALVSVIKNHWKGNVRTLDQWSGWKIPIGGKYWVCPTYHPSYLLRSNSPLLDQHFSDHLEEAFAIKRDPPALSESDKYVELLYDEHHVYAALREIAERGGWAAIDIETNCLKPEYEKARIYCCSVSNGKKTVAYPWIGKNIETTKKFIRSPRIQMIGAQIKMEERWFQKEFGVGVIDWGWDTVIAAHCLDNRAGITSLKFQVFVQFGIETYNENVEPYLEQHKGHLNRIHEVELGTLLEYNGHDTLFTYHLARKQRKMLGYDN